MAAVRGRDEGSECFRFQTQPDLPRPPVTFCDSPATVTGANGSSPMTLEIADSEGRAAYIFGGVAPELKSVTIHRRGGSTSTVHPRNRTLVSYQRDTDDITSLSFVAGAAFGECVTGTEAATFNCSWAGL